MQEDMQDLVRYATLAANGHNAQAWKFAVSDSAIEIHPDPARHLQMVDPDDRELWISLGCALENLLIAARAGGHVPGVTYPDSTESIVVRLTPGAPQADPLFGAIMVRQSTRSEYDGRPVRAEDLAQMRAVPLEPGVSLRFVTELGQMATVLEFLTEANLKQYADRDFVEELIHWLRFNKKEALTSRDGLYTRATGNPEVPRWLGRIVVSATKPATWAAGDAKKLRTSPGAVVIASATDDRTAWVRTGQVYERLALTMTTLGIRSAFLNQPIEVSTVRDRFGAAMGLEGAHPQLLARFGYAVTMPRSVRRPVEDVLL